MTDETPIAIRATRGAILKEYEDGSLAVRLLVAPPDKQTFMRMFPDVNLPMFIARETQESAQAALQDETTERHFGEFARELRLHSDWMGNPRVWQAIGTDEEYLAWCRQQPCAHCKRKPYWEGDTFVLSEAAHVRRVANGSGTGIKPSYSAIALCHPCHAAQHGSGESAIGGKEAVDKLRMQSVYAWIWHRMHLIFGVESMRELEPATLFAWARTKGVEQYLPRIYREAA